MFGLEHCASAVGGGWDSSGGDKGFGENVSDEERLMNLGSSSGNTYGSSGSLSIFLFPAVTVGCLFSAGAFSPCPWAEKVRVVRKQLGLTTGCPLDSEGQGSEKAVWLNNRLCPAGGRGRWVCPWLLHVRICVWPCLPCRALGSLGLPKMSHTKKVSVSTSGEAQLAKVNVNSSAL